MSCFGAHFNFFTWKIITFRDFLYIFAVWLVVFPAFFLFVKLLRINQKMLICYIYLLLLKAGVAQGGKSNDKVACRVADLIPFVGSGFFFISRIYLFNIYWPDKVRIYRISHLFPTAYFYRKIFTNKKFNGCSYPDRIRIQSWEDFFINKPWSWACFFSFLLKDRIRIQLFFEGLLRIRFFSKVGSESGFP